MFLPTTRTLPPPHRRLTHPSLTDGIDVVDARERDAAHHREPHAPPHRRAPLGSGGAGGKAGGVDDALLDLEGSDAEEGASDDEGGAGAGGSLAPQPVSRALGAAVASVAAAGELHALSSGQGPALSGAPGAARQSSAAAAPALASSASMGTLGRPPLSLGLTGGRRRRGRCGQRGRRLERHTLLLGRSASRGSAGAVARRAAPCAPLLGGHARGQPHPRAAARHPRRASLRGAAGLPAAPVHVHDCAPAGQRGRV